VWAYLPDSSIKVFANGYQQSAPWDGGFNNPQFSNADLNNDGVMDLVVFEPNIGVKTFINEGTPGNPRYVYAPKYALNFPPCWDYLLMADYNRDGITDLFEGYYDGITGFVAYQGYFNSNNELCFNYYRVLFYDNQGPGFSSTNAFNNPSWIPAIVDVDNDGDLDFLGYEVQGFYIQYYRNMQQELGLPKDTISIVLEDQCWGRAYQGWFRSFIMPITCNNSNLIDLDAAYYRTMHSGNALCLFDYNDDGDYDVLNGNILFNQLTLLTNGKTDYHHFCDTMIAQDTAWQSTGTQVNINYWPAAYNVDADGDGVKDLLISPNGQPGENYNTIWYYKNLTTAGHPDWVFESDSFLVDQSIDLGTAAYPTLFDYNKDGKPDLFIGSDGYYQPATGQLVSKISYYENTSTPGNPSFTLVTKDFMSLDSFGFAGAAPAFGDIDNDGITDLIIGHSNGTITYFKNMAGSDTAVPDWQLQQLTLTTSDSVIIQANGGYAAPCIYDIDKDGKPDILVGDMYGYLEFYHNTNTSPGTPSFSFDNRELGGIRADPKTTISPNYATPYIGKIDTTGVDYLLMGSYSGNIYRFTGFQTGDTTATYTMLDTTYANIDTTYSTYNHGETLVSCYQGMRSAPVVGCIPGDGTFDLLVGEIRGGVNCYKYGLDTVNSASKLTDNGRISVYPNPAKDNAHISWENLKGNTGRLQIDVSNTTGQILFSTVVAASANFCTIPVGNLATGIYMCSVASGPRKYYAKLVVIHN